MKNRNAFAIIISLMIIVLSGCIIPKPINSSNHNESENTTVLSSNQICESDAQEGIEYNANFLENITTCYTDEELNSIVRFQGTVAELNHQYPIELVYDTEAASETEEVSYQVYVYKGKEAFVCLFYNGDKRCFGTFHRLSYYLDDYLAGLSIGMDYNEVRKFDPEGDYTLFESEFYLNDIESDHFTKDGYYIILHYDDSFRVDEIETHLFMDYYDCFHPGNIDQSGAHSAIDD